MNGAVLGVLLDRVVQGKQWTGWLAASESNWDPTDPLHQPEALGLPPPPDTPWKHDGVQRQLERLAAVGGLYGLGLTAGLGLGDRGGDELVGVCAG